MFIGIPMIFILLLWILGWVCATGTSLLGIFGTFVGTLLLPLLALGWTQSLLLLGGALAIAVVGFSFALTMLILTGLLLQLLWNGALLIFKNDLD